MTVSKYITENWNKTLRPAGAEDDASIPLPKPFNVPSLDKRFNNLFYWDTYFLNLGLLEDGLLEQAKNNLVNMAFLIEKLGYMPNSNHLIYHSQPPLFTRGVYDLYLYTRDKETVFPFLTAMKKEHDFFSKTRSTPVGLTRYGCDLDNRELEQHYGYHSGRMNMDFESENERHDFTRNMFAICESGWDVTSRFNRPEKSYAALEFAPIDLNSILYDMECKIAEFCTWTGDNESAVMYDGYAKMRKDLINKYMLDKKTGLYYDYNFEHDELSEVFSAASLFPYALGVSKDIDGLKKALERLEFDHGISGTEKLETVGVQWDYPQMWPSNVWAAFVALESCNLIQDAERIAKKYIQSIDKTFEETGTLWEKYNAETGFYANPKLDEAASPMLGWTAGVYKYLSRKVS